MNTIIFSDEITVWWDKEEQGTTYRIYLNRQFVGKTDKTHWRFSGLSPSTAYILQVKKIFMNKTEVFYEKALRTSDEKRRIDVTQAPYNAVGDGKTLCTDALQKAIEACEADSYVYIPNGTFLTGALDLHGNMELRVDGVLQGSVDAKDYLPKRHSRFEGIEMECYRSLLTLGEVEWKRGATFANFILRGNGKVFGGGKELAENIIRAEGEELKTYISSLGDKIKEYECDRTLAGRARGRLLQISNTRNAVISGLTVGFSPSWNIQTIYSENIVIAHTKILSEGVWNGDGIDPDSTTNCTIFDVDFHTHDDCIAIKSGKNPEGNKIARPTKNVKIFDCRCTHGNGIAIGSEMSGGVEGVYIWDCNLINTYTGVRVKTIEKRGGYVRNLQVSNCYFPRVLVTGKYPWNADGEGAKEKPIFENFHFENITLTGKCMWSTGKIEYATPITVEGFESSPKNFRNIHFKNVRIKNLPSEVKEKIKIVDAEKVTMEMLEVER